MKKTSEILICGAGIVGLTLAHSLLKKGIKNITIIEKEKEVGQHASGRNSGILHAGIYYSPDSFKAKFCLKGNHLLREYCQKNDLPILETGKYIICQNKQEHETLHTLYNRAQKNGTPVSLISEKQLQNLEPLTSSYKEAIFSPKTAVVNPKSILNCLTKELQNEPGINIFYNTKFQSLIDDHTILTDNGTFSFDYLINAAGAYGDKIAHACNIGKQYRLLPFKGLYKKLNPKFNNQIHRQIYPVPDLRNPFLGVHITKTISGDIYFGPTATPVFAPEKTVGKESLSILYANAILFFKNPGFRSVALSEPKRYIHKYFCREARKLMPKLKDKDVLPCNKWGIRPQLVNWKTKELVMDFLVEQKDNQLHILNAISPAFTASFAMSEYIVSRYLNK